MKKYLLAFSALFLFSSVQAQILECPSIHKKSKLVDATAFFDKITQIQGEFVELKNGYNLILPLNVKYLVCDYRNKTNLWKEFTPNKEVKDCILRLREQRKRDVTIKLECT